MGACVPAKKYNELLEKEKQCSEELAEYKSQAIQKGGQLAEAQSQIQVLSKAVVALKKDTSDLGSKYRILQAQYDNLNNKMKTVEKSFDQYRTTGNQTTSQLQSNLEAKRLELQRKQDELNSLSDELDKKQSELSKREERIKELEEVIARQDEFAKKFKEKVVKALVGFENKGLSVYEKNGKIYVSLEAKLLFSSGSILVEEEGVNALIELSKVLEKEKDLEIVVEGHTDIDPIHSSNHPRNNWELSVLRATSVVSILMENSTINPKQLIASGRSQYLPVDVNDKTKNRRIEIIISPNLDELYRLIDEQ